MSIRANDLIFLLGAGCSYDAGVPITSRMIELIETDLLSKKPWNKYKELYYYIKSSIVYADGILGVYSPNINIERFVNTLSELHKQERHSLYPFISNWDQRLIRLAGTNFEHVQELKELIVKQVVSWIKVDNYQQKADYYKKFYDFQNELQMPCRVFSLNYDLCLERIKPEAAILETGFDPDSRKWNASRFEENDVLSVNIYLYKLHGSIDWKRNIQLGYILTVSDNPEDEPDLIFGTDVKLQPIDPYLFYVHQFREYSLSCKLIIVIGYSFGDNYINGLLKQALDHDKNRRILYITPNSSETSDRMAQKLEVTNSSARIQCLPLSAKDFLENHFSLNTIEKYMPSGASDVF